MSVKSLKDYIDLENYCEEHDSQKDTDEEETIKPSTDDSDTSDENDELLDEFNEISHARDEGIKRRMESLRHTMNILQKEVEYEKQLCLQLVEDLRNIHQNHGGCIYNQFHHRNQEGFQSGSSVPSFVPLSDYNMQITNYQDALIQAQSMNKLNIQRQMAITNYRRRLLEVENMCNLELLKVKQSVQYLQPLRIIASEWQKEMEGGDGDTTVNQDKNAGLRKQDNSDQADNNNGDGGNNGDMASLEYPAKSSKEKENTDENSSK